MYEQKITSVSLRYVITSPLPVYNDDLTNSLLKIGYEWVLLPKEAS